MHCKAHSWPLNDTKVRHFQRGEAWGNPLVRGRNPLSTNFLSKIFRKFYLNISNFSVKKTSSEHDFVLFIRRNWIYRTFPQIIPVKYHFQEARKISNQFFINWIIIFVSKFDEFSPYDSFQISLTSYMWLSWKQPNSKAKKHQEPNRSGTKNSVNRNSSLQFPAIICATNACQTSPTKASRKRC